MKIQHIRNATMIVESGDRKILVDPMMSKKGVYPTFTLLRFRPRKNPVVDLPDNAKESFRGITDCLVTHKHPDHIDKVAEAFLIENNIPVVCSELDEELFKKKGLLVSQTIKYWQKSEYLGGSITGIPARHGYGFIAKPMGNVTGFYIELPNEPSLYLSSDTIYTPEVKKALDELKPDITVVASGTAQLDIGQPLLMRIDDIVKFIRNSPGKAIANHLEAVNHCPTSRQQLKEILSKEGLLNKTWIPDDGDALEFD
ncbi:MAG: MBL fold metallo-hydrolase [Bacteroidota bacterium]